MWRLVVVILVMSCIIEGKRSKTTRRTLAPQPGLTVSTGFPYKPENRVVGGQPAPIEKYPYAVQLTMFGVLYCGGTLITRSHVLTAAHCAFRHGKLINLDDIHARVGSAIPREGGTRYPLQNFVHHLDYNVPERDNDIGICVIMGKVTFSSAVKAATLVPRDFEVEEGSRVIYIGWGYLGTGAPQASVLQEVPVLVVNWTICKQNYFDLETATARLYPITENMFCAGLLDVGGKDACGGDSGGPVVQGGVVVGIISWGLFCAQKTYPGVNIQVSRYLDWITKTVEMNLEIEPHSSAVHNLLTTEIVDVGG